VSLILPIHAAVANWSVDESYPQDITVITIRRSLSLSLTSAQAQSDHSGLTRYVTVRRANNDKNLGLMSLLQMFFLLRVLANRMLSAWNRGIRSRRLKKTVL
jgi:hypothetical protein